MNAIPHPSSFLAPALSDALRALSADAERLGALHPGQLELIYRQQWFNLFVPADFGGLQQSLPEALRLEEALAWTDGSVGWTVTICSGAAWFIGFLPPSAAREIFNSKKVCLAGSGQPSGIAERTAAGYRLTGHWKYATGAPHATVFTANCLLHQEGAPLLDSNGQPQVRAFWLYKEEVAVHPTWHTVGMVATASHSFSVQGLTVPEDRSFCIEPHAAVLAHPIFHYPFLPFAETTLAVNSAGMAVRFLDLCPPSAMRDSAQHRLQQLRASFYSAADASWIQLLQTQTLPAATLASVSTASRQLAAGSLQLVDQLYPLCGLAAADPRSEINRVWRNLHTASQHALLRQPG